MEKTAGKGDSYRMMPYWTKEDHKAHVDCLRRSGITSFDIAIVSAWAVAVLLGWLG